MKIELLGAINYDKLSAYIDEKLEELDYQINEIKGYLKQIDYIQLDKENTIMLIDDLLEFVSSKQENNEYDALINKLKRLKTETFNTLEDTDNLIDKIKKELNDIDNSLESKKEEALEEIKKLEKERRTNIVATSGRLSRYPGTVFDILETIEGRDNEKNLSFISRVTSMGHESITDHDYLVFAIEDVSPIIEQTIIAERFSSFTIKSRREVDFSNVGFYVPDFHDNSGNILENNEEIKQEYIKHMNELFKSYSLLVEVGIPKEDARFVLPYSYYSNIIMGVDAHTLKDMIVKYTKTRLSNIQELREFGERLYEIAKENIPYIIPSIDKIKVDDSSPVREYIESIVNVKNTHEILDKPVLLNATENTDLTICISALQRLYGCSKEDALSYIVYASYKDQNFIENLIRKVTFEGDKQELTSVNFTFQVPLSFAVLTHLTRHRTHEMLIPEFAPNVDITKYKTPPKIKQNPTVEYTYNNIYEENKIIYDKFKNEYKVRDEDLVYFTLSGNMVNVITNMNGKTLEHILGLRECSKAQWETRNMAIGMHNEIDKIDNTANFSKVLGATCMTQRTCNEGKECCGRIDKLLEQDEKKKILKK